MRTRLSPRPATTHGGASRLPIDLSASLNPLGPSPIALQAARSAELGSYPRADAHPLASAAAARHGLEQSWVVPVAGASWGLWLCLLAYAGGRRCLALGPCFGEYRRLTEISGGVYSESEAELEQALKAEPEVCLLGNPANPTGAALEADRLEDACNRHAGTLFIVDEAFAAFAPAGTSLIDRRSPPSNAIVVRSLTKELGLPGLRMGYLVTAELRARSLREMQPPWPLSAPALAAGAAGCSDQPHIQGGAEVARRHLALMAQALGQIGAEVRPSSANYLLCRAPTLLGDLAAEGIAGRDCASFGLPGWVRLAAPSPGELPAVLKAIQRG
ncbi:MAG TPA: aminotransferase class I/II-fold pyridoxal phosphate-dependent enzyme [Candidatus Nitrosotalea sp.]|nr:aminotransferase class I/II-fold pyridoxal phosphate-dependent enzyme [Candidatus Nitrosotalea sp.]